ncbi:hypothetical protein GJU40_08175 [Bacillus lacus]|uniref:Uncharacterized protein n=1 Tax=Metabacillus lacus TaxID=1983721 RepID=A0A7X2IYH7_9BACI|nr:hypothetical protein [Metabacillus lacus]MRX72137.1 hypothetical protein [Metabacillus lacus]
MGEDQELSRMEDQWKKRFDRFTSPEPTREQTFSLIEKIKEVEEIKPVDLRAELEANQSAQSMFSKILNLFLSQWNFHGTASWLLTGIVMLVLTITISHNSVNEIIGYMTWIKWITLIIIAVISYSFRSGNEGNEIIEKLSYYSLIQQMFTRFMIVMGLQLAITLPLSFLILGRANSILYLLSSFTPIFFFGVVGFVSTFWFGQKIGSTFALIVWFSQTLFDKQLKSASMFQLPENDYFFLLNSVIIGFSCLMLSSVLLRNRLLRDME